MFGRKPRFPVETYEKVDIECSLDWLLKALGFEQAPDVTQLTRKSASLRRLIRSPGSQVGDIFEFVQQQLPFDTSHCHLVVVQGEEAGFDAREMGAGDPSAIYVGADESQDLDLLIAEIACQLARGYLIQIVEDEHGEWISEGSDYLPMLFGLGVFCANSSLLSNQVTMGEIERWAFWKLRSIPARYYGVAMACLAYRSGSTATDWHRELRPDAKVAFQKSLSYYEKTGDCLTLAAPSQRVFENDDNDHLISLLDGATPGTIFGVLSELQANFKLAEQKPPAKDLSRLSGMLPAFLEHKDSSVRYQSARFCLQFETIEDATVQSLKLLLADNESRIREASLQALVQLAIPGRLMLSEIRTSLRDHDLNVADWAAMGVMQIGQKDEAVVYDALPTIRRAVNAGEWETAVHLCEALETLTEKSDEKLEEFFADSPNQLADLRLEPRNGNSSIWMVDWSFARMFEP